MTHTLTQGATAIALTIYVLLALLLLGSLLPTVAGYQIRLVESGSMEPTIPVGAAIVVAPKDSYAVGDVVTFQRRTDARATTHRIVEERESGFITQGDANDSADLRVVAREEIVGAVRADIPFLGYVLSFLRTPVGFIVLVGVPAGYIIAEQWRVIRREVRKTRTDSNHEQD